MRHAFMNNDYQSKKPSTLVRSSVSTQDEERLDEAVHAAEAPSAAALDLDTQPTGPLSSVKHGVSPSVARLLQRKRRPVVRVLGTLFVIAAVVFEVWKLNANAMPDVTLYKVSMQQISLDVGGGGLVYPYQQLDVSYPVAERVINVLVKA